MQLRLKAALSQCLTPEHINCKKKQQNNVWSEAGRELFDFASSRFLRRNIDGVSFIQVQNHYFPSKMHPIAKVKQKTAIV